MTITRGKLAAIGGGAALLVLALLALSVSRQVCLGAWMSYGLVVERCPDGQVHLGAGLDASALRRGSDGFVQVRAFGLYTEGPADQVRKAPLKDFTAELSLVRQDGREEKLAPEGGLQRDGTRALGGAVTLPADLPDGEHTLKAVVKSAGLGEATVTAKLPVYAPARVHVLTDRPLYEPGNTLRYRAVVLRARDLSPLEGRPGRFVVTDATGQTVLEEEAPAGPFGVAAGSLPIDEGATHGSWRVRWESGDAADEVSVRVEPFTLPRFLVELQPEKAFYGKGEAPRLKGRVRYASGAAAEASLAVEWDVAGEWPAPPRWLSTELPREAKTGAGGAFTLDLPKVPADLRGKVTLRASVVATDPTGDRASGGGSVLLSEDKIALEAVTELEGGLVEGFNNRVYLRASTAGGAPLANVELVVRRAWDESDEGTVTATDDDGVAALQLDPGPAVNVLIPPMPVRVRPREAEAFVERVQARELIASRSPTLKELTAMDAWNEVVLPCARFATSDRQEAELSFLVERFGSLSGFAAKDSLGRCVADELARRRLPAADGPRIFRLRLAFTAKLPRLALNEAGTGGVPPPLMEALQEAALDARACLPGDARAAQLPRLLLWRLDGKRVSARFEPDENTRGAPLSGRPLACVEGRLKAVTRPLFYERDDDESRFGVVRLRVSPVFRPTQATPQPTTMLGYELAVRARRDGDDLGSTTLRLRPGQVPPLRLRATPVLPEPGERVRIDLLRGPDYAGELPEELVLTHEQSRLKAPVDDKRGATFELPKDLSGWFEASFGGATARVYVKGDAELQVDLQAERASYAPGDDARLVVRTTAGGEGTRAAVTLVGVDETLAVLAPLPAPDEMARLRPKVDMRRSAFGVLDAEALTLGRIRGEHAAAATVLLVSRVPAPAELDAPVSASARTSLDPVAKLTDPFYVVLGEHYAAVRAWEAAAEEGEQMTPAKMAELWQQALATCEARGDEVNDAFGRPLRLSRLPADLLALAGPRAAVLDGTRLPEDVEDWVGYVRRERP